jgi:hypothetical protein
LDNAVVKAKVSSAGSQWNHWLFLGENNHSAKPEDKWKDSDEDSDDVDNRVG